MKNRFLKFLQRYYILIILSLVHPLAMVTAEYWGNVIITRGALGPFRSYDFYLVCFLPIFHFVYGGISFIITKKVFIPNFTPTAIYFMYFGALYLKKFDFAIENFYSMLFFSLFPIVFSMIGTLITAGVSKVIKSMKKSGN